MRPATGRRVIHSATALVLLMGQIDVWALRWLVWSVAVFVLTVDLVRIKNVPFNTWLRRTVPVFRESEATSISGASFLWLGYSMTVFFPLPAAFVGILAAAVADPAASLVGSKWGSGKGKTLMGSAACFAAILGVSLAFSVSPQVGLVVALFGTTLERFSGPVDDNMVIGPGVAAAVFFLA